MADLHSPSLDRLFRVIRNLKDEDECYAFFEDLCTVKELKDMAQRLDVAFLLHEGMNYQNIAQKTLVSTATISRVKKCLDYGAGGYSIAIAQTEENE